MKKSEATDKIREICTYHSDDGTSGYLLSEEKFEKIFELVDQAEQNGADRREKELTDNVLNKHNPDYLPSWYKQHHDKK